MSITTIIMHEGELSAVRDIKDIYTGPASLATGGKHVPNVGDYVTADSGILKVKAVNSAHIPTLEMYISRGNDNDVSKDTFERNLNRNYHLTRHHVFINDNEQTATVDSAIPVFNAEVGKLFLGTDISSNGRVISDTSVPGGPIKDTVTLEASPIPNSSPAIKSIPVFGINTTVPHGSVCTFVAYSATGEVVYQSEFIVNKTGAVMPANANTDYIHSIEIDHYSVSPTEPDTIIRDLGVPFDTSSMRCKVTMVSGQVSYVNVDNINASVTGLGDFNTHLLGTPTEAVLIYKLGPTQRAVGTNGNPRNPTMTKKYKVVNYKKKQTFNYRLWLLPRWDLNRGRWDVGEIYMTSIDYDVNKRLQLNQVQITGLDFTLLETRQDVTLSVSMDDVLPGVHPGHVHVQTLSIELRQPSSFGQDPFIIDYVGGRTKRYGSDLKPGFVTSGTPHLDLTSNAANKEEWLNRFYYESAPIYDAELLQKAPEPTHVLIETSTTTVELDIDDWNTEILRTVQDSYIEFDNINFTWIIKENTKTKYLAKTNSIIRRV